MKVEIRNDVREYILSEVNMTLARLGVSEQVKETKEFENKYNDLLEYQFGSAPIRQMPMMFKRLTVDGYMVAIMPKDEKDRFYKVRDTHYIIVVNVGYSCSHFDGGRNGCDIGRMVFLVDRDLPKSFDEENWIMPDTYIRKVEGLTI